MSTCRYAGRNEPRVLPRRHADDCADPSTCSGCLPCPGPHCRVCGRNHAETTCAGCIADVRETLAAITEMCAALAAEAEHRGTDSDAAMLAGPVADPEAWSHHKRSALAGRIDAGWLEHAEEAAHPLFVLGTWEMLGRELLGLAPGGEAVSVLGSGAWLDLHLHQLAELADDFDVLRRELNDCRAYVEAVLHDGEQVERGVKCPMCGRANLVKRYGMTEDGDRWCCPRRDCGAAYTEGDYRAKVEAIYVLHAPALTASQLRAAYRIRPGTLRMWVQRDLVRQVGRDHRGRVLYDREQAVATRDRAGAAGAGDDRV